MTHLYLSYFLNEHTPAYGGAEGTVQLENLGSIDEGKTSNNSRVSFPSHIGTHIDFPFHFSNSGKKSNDYPASFWIFEKIGFLDCSIDSVEDQIDSLPQDIELLILKTGFGAKRVEQDYWASQPVIPAQFAWLFRSKFPSLRVFGFDMISLTSKLNKEEGRNAHLAFLLEHNILVLEDMNLEFLRNTPQRVIIAPLLIENADGTPCTVIASS